MKEIAIKLSNVSKMPWYSYNTPASKCQIGSELINIPGSTCHGCYARRNNYRYPVVKNSMLENFNAMKLPEWKISIREHIKSKRDKTIKRRKIRTYFFRWFDSGDLQNEQMLKDIVAVCKDIPTMNFWLPTREVLILATYVYNGNEIPRNLKIRVSDKMVDQEFSEHQKIISLMNLMPNVKRRIGTSGVTTDITKTNCIAHEQGNKCFGEKKTCADCWLDVKEQDRVIYPKI